MRLILAFALVLGACVPPNPQTSSLNRLPEHQVIPGPRQGTNPQRWEYLCLARPALRDIQAAGKRGWELVVVVPKDSAFEDTVLCFKRPL